MALEKASGATRMVGILRREIVRFERLGRQAAEKNDIEGACQAQAAASRARQDWFRLFGWPTPPKSLRPPEKPVYPTDPEAMTVVPSPISRPLDSGKDSGNPGSAGNEAETGSDHMLSGQLPIENDVEPASTDGDPAGDGDQDEGQDDDGR